ncbi:MAG: Uma2 family endonuclease [Methylohalobius sp. ZOD2]
MPILRKNGVLTVEEYLEGEKHADIRHEYERGEVVAMIGASRNHNRLTGRIFADLLRHLEDTPCEAFASDMKVRVDDCFYYPDVVVDCDPKDDHDFYLEHPVLIVEVLSESTEQRDRTVKRLAYQSIPGLREYLLLAQDRVRAELYRCSGSGWDLEIYGAGEVMRLASVDLELPLAEIYRGVRLLDSSKT